MKSSNRRIGRRLQIKYRGDTVVAERAKRETGEIEMRKPHLCAPRSIVAAALRNQPRAMTAKAAKAEQRYL